MDHVRYDDLGRAVLRAVPEGAQRTLLYAELEPGVALVSIFYELDGLLFYVEPTDEIFDEVERLQLVYPEDVRAIEFTIKGTNFSNHFTYADGFDELSSDLERRDVVLIKQFGHSSVTAPSN